MGVGCQDSRKFFFKKKNLEVGNFVVHGDCLTIWREKKMPQLCYSVFKVLCYSFSQFYLSWSLQKVSRASLFFSKVLSTSRNVRSTECLRNE